MATQSSQPSKTKKTVGAGHAGSLVGLDRTKAWGKGRSRKPGLAPPPPPNARPQFAPGVVCAASILNSMSDVSLCRMWCATFSTAWVFNTTVASGNKSSAQQYPMSSPL